MKFSDSIKVSAKGDLIIESREEVEELMDQLIIQYPEFVNHELFAIVTGVNKELNFLYITHYLKDSTGVWAIDKMQHLTLPTEFWKISPHSDYERYERHLKFQTDHITV